MIDRIAKIIDAAARRVAEVHPSSQYQSIRMGIVQNAAEQIRDEVLSETKKQLGFFPPNGSLWSPGPNRSTPFDGMTVKKPSKKLVKEIKRKLETQREERLAEEHRRKAASPISDTFLRTRIRQVVYGAGEMGISVNTLFQRMLNHRDLIGNRLQIDQVVRLASKLSQENVIRREGAGRKAVLFKAA